MEKKILKRLKMELGSFKIKKTLENHFKELNPSLIDIIENDFPILTVKVVSEKWINETIPERVDVLTDLLHQKDDGKIALNYAISFIPLTTKEDI